MDLPAAFLVVRLLVRDTFRQSLASRLFWLIVAASGLCIVLCLSVRVEGVTAEKPAGEIELFGPDRKPFTGQHRGQGYIAFAFGAVRVQMTRDAETAVSFLHALLAIVVMTVGLLLLLLWTCGFLPEFLDPRSVSVLLAKPVPRWSLLAGKFAGVLLFVVFQVILFVGGTWLALGLRTGIWHPAFLLSIPMLVLLFAIFCSVSTVLAVWTRSAVACLFGTLLFWGFCAGVDHARYAPYRQAELPSPDAIRSRPLIEAGYWLLPKPADCVFLLGETLQIEQHFRQDPGMLAAAKARAIIPELSLLSSLLFAVAMLALAGARFVRQDF
jgi:ABC-type transport system involved in multi-copper enzyme maturation permease subunit